MTSKVARVVQLTAHAQMQCATWLLAGPRGPVLVDPGSGLADGRILQGVREGGYDPAELTHVLLTHCHADHTLGAWRWRERGARLVASPYTAEVLRSGDRRVWYEYPEYVVPTEVDVEVADGGVLALAGMSIQAVAIPGHTPGCVAYLLDTAEGLTALTGDLLCDNGHPGWAGSEGFSVAQSLASLERLLALRPERAYWGHGPILEPAAEWLRRGIDLGRAGEWELSGDPHPEMTPPEGLPRGR